MLGHPHVSEVHVAVVLGVEAYFGANIPSLHPRKAVEVFVPDGHQEGIDPVILPFYYCLGKHHRVVGVQPQLPRPVLRGRGSGGVNDPLLRGGVVCGSRLEVPDVGPVAHLGLRIAPQYLASLCLFQVEPLVLLGSHELNILDEHAKVRGGRPLLRVDQHGINIPVIVGQVLWVGVVEGSRDGRQVLD